MIRTRTRTRINITVLYCIRKVLFWMIACFSVIITLLISDLIWWLNNKLFSKFVQQNSSHCSRYIATGNVNHIAYRKRFMIHVLWMQLKPFRLRLRSLWMHWQLEGRVMSHCAVILNAVIHVCNGTSKNKQFFKLSGLSLIHIWRCRRIERCRSRWSPYH